MSEPRRHTCYKHGWHVRECPDCARECVECEHCDSLRAELQEAQAERDGFKRIISHEHIVAENALREKAQAQASAGALAKALEWYADSDNHKMQWESRGIYGHGSSRHDHIVNRPSPVDLDNGMRACKALADSGAGARLLAERDALRRVVRESEEYLSNTTPGIHNFIGTGSILHQKMREALGGGEEDE